jgi:uncharacterized protein YfdQ (DUF2303 family)
MANKTEHEAKMETAVVALARLDFDPAKRAQHLILPEALAVRDMEALQDRPNRIRADHVFLEAADLTNYVNDFGDADTMISCDYAAGRIQAVIDAHQAEGPADVTLPAPRWGSHKAAFKAVVDHRMAAWLGVCKRPMSQLSFMVFLEDRATDVQEPDPATIMDLIMTFDAIKTVTFRSSQRLHDGRRQFTYNEENKGNGAVTLPEHLILFLPIYQGMEPQPVKFMLRYRIDDGSLSFVVEMHNQVDVMREAFQRCVDAFSVGLDLQYHLYVVG